MAADQESKSEENGNGNRATVAMVLRAVDDLGKLTDANFAAVRGQLKSLEVLPAQVAALHERQVLIEARVLNIEQSDAMQVTAMERRAAWRSTTLPALVIAGGSLFVAVLSLVVSAIS